MCKTVVHKPACPQSLYVGKRRLSLLNSEHIHLQGIDFDVGRGKANVLPEYYRKLGPGRNRQRAATQVFPIRDGIVKEEGAQIGPV